MNEFSNSKTESPNVETVWTAKEQAMLDELGARRERIFAKHDARLSELIDSVIKSAYRDSPPGQSPDDALLNSVKANAATLRDALKPYDLREGGKA